VLEAGEVFAERLREVRNRRDWSTRELARRVTELGHPLAHTAIWKLEQGERVASLQDVLSLSLALGVSPLYMISPVRGDDRLQVASAKPAVDDLIARRWLRGLDTLHDEDPWFFFREQPDWEIRRDREISERERKSGKTMRRPWLERPKRWLNLSEEEAK
jgi:transcriptional regulator with XRE-family HTH domain